jgi:hypothetical protein
VQCARPNGARAATMESISIIPLVEEWLAQSTGIFGITRQLRKTEGTVAVGGILFGLEASKCALRSPMD